MRKAVKKRWIEALTSGEYKQGKKALKTKRGSFCCLGVLCDLYGKTKKVNWEKDLEKENVNTFLGNSDFLPKEVAEWAGIPQERLNDRSSGGEFESYDIALEDPGKYDSLADANDEGAKFKTIAKLIEAQL